MKRVPNGKEYRARLVSRRNNSSRSGGPYSNSKNSSNNEAARRHQPITARDMGSRRVDIKDNPGKRHLQGSNNFGALTPAAPERKFRSRFCL